MNKSELLVMMAEKHPQWTEKLIVMAVDCLLDGIGDALAAGRRVEVRGFGCLGLNCRQARIARNPRTGTQVSVPMRYLPYFKAGKGLREAVAASEAARHPEGLAATDGEEADLPVRLAANPRYSRY